ncbi:hypothetical protein [Pseudomonas batumici]|uniref:Uncharacterized protein n=1 Tax=Pseudomonas batumici TaxID=226910 RepID=A0A0C2E473_9PSED|nr:hypothetical protein [Pseudomonas batumici]KIH80569.1 hypothetical protein UCMB321_5698 [Pseudomonas batumici]
MDIERLLRKRQLNVQEQNAVSAYWLMRTAKTWMGTDVPAALAQYGETQGVNWSETIVLKLEVDFPGMPRLFGLLLTQADRFVAFEIDTDSTHQQIESVDRWEDVSAHQDYSTSNSGTGKGFAAIARHVKRELLAQLRNS